MIRIRSLQSVVRSILLKPLIQYAAQTCIHANVLYRSVFYIFFYPRQTIPNVQGEILINITLRYEEKNNLSIARVKKYDAHISENGCITNECFMFMFFMLFYIHVYEN